MGSQRGPRIRCSRGSNWPFCGHARHGDGDGCGAGRRERGLNQRQPHRIGIEQRHDMGREADTVGDARAQIAEALRPEGEIGQRHGDAGAAQRADGAGEAHRIGQLRDIDAKLQAPRRKAGGRERRQHLFGEDGGLQLAPADREAEGRADIGAELARRLAQGGMAARASSAA